MSNLIVTRARRPRDARPVWNVAALLGACGLGALAEYFLFDRRHAALRRHVARDRTRAALRRFARTTARRAKYLEGVAEGMAYTVAHAVPGVDRGGEPPDDITLAQKVESEAFRMAGVPKHHVNVNAEKGVVFLRGQLDRPDQIDALVRATRAISGVRDVRCLLHTPEGAAANATTMRH